MKRLSPLLFTQTSICTLPNLSLHHPLRYSSFAKKDQPLALSAGNWASADACFSAAAGVPGAGTPTAGDDVHSRVGRGCGRRSRGVGEDMLVELA